MTDLPLALRGSPRLGDWLGFGPQRTVLIRSGKVEIGQGIGGALAGIAAGALSVPRAAIRMEPPRTGVSPDEGVTAGSLSVQHSGAAIGTVCAMVRALALAAAARRLGEAVEALDISGGIPGGIPGGAVVRVGSGAATGLDYWALADEIDLNLHADALPLPRVAPPVPGPRPDFPARLRGGGFLHDLSLPGLLPGLLHARMLRHPGPPMNAPRPDFGAHPLPEGVALVREGAFAALIGESEARVARAAERLLALTAPQRPPALPWEAEALADRPARRSIEEIGVPGPARNPAARHRARYSRPYLAHASIGPSCGVALWSPGAAPRLTVWTHSQGIYPLRRSLAEALRLDPGAIEVRHVPGAGCYGHNGADDAAADAAFLARARPGRPVRVHWTRAEEMGAAPLGGAMLVEIEAGVDADGLPVDWQITVRSPTHSQRPGTGPGWPTRAAQETGAAAMPVPEDVPAALGSGGMRNARALYDLPVQRLVHEFVPDPGLRTSALRGLGAHANVFAIEGFIDELAEAQGRDPLAYRLALLSDQRARAVLERLALRADWAGRGAGGTGQGLGLGLARYKNSAAFAAVAVAVTVEEAVRMDRIWAVVDAGTLVDPDGALNQIEGGLLQSASWTLHEAIRPGPEGAFPANWDGYPILRFSEVPDLEVEFIESDAPPLGLGEAVVGPTAAALGNAVAHALGFRLRALPLSGERLAAAILAQG